MKHPTHLRHRITRKGRRATPRAVKLSYYDTPKRLAPTGMHVWFLTPEEAAMVRKIPATIVKRIEGPREWPPVKKPKAEPPPKPARKKKAKRK